MKAGTYVQFTGILPVELQKIKKRPIYGTVVKKIGAHKVEVKPRYKRFTVVVKLVDLTEVAYEAFHKKQTHPKKKTKKKKVSTPKPAPVVNKEPVTKVTVEGDGPVRVEPISGKETFPEIVAEKIETAEASIDQAKEGPDVKFSTEEPIEETTAPVEETVPDTVPDVECESELESYNDWDREFVPIDPIKEMEQYLDEQESSSGGVLVYVVIGIIAIGVAAAIYFFN